MAQRATLVDILTARAAAQAGERVYLFLCEHGAEEASLSYGELFARAKAVAARLSAAAAPGERALLMFPSGLEFVIALFGCFPAPVVGGPVMVPRRQSSRSPTATIM